MAAPGSSLTPSGRDAQCAVCDAWVPTGRKAGSSALSYAAHPNPRCAGYQCIESGRPVPSSRLRRR